MSSELKILMLEDNEYDVALIRRELSKSALLFHSVWATNKREFEENLSSFSPDIILSDHTLPQFDSLSALQIVQENYPHIPFVLVTGSVSEEFAVKCIKNGAEDYVLKSNLIRLPGVIENAIKKKDLKKENDLIRKLNRKIKEAYKIITEKNKDITDSITYSQRIQNALLPSGSELEKMFPQSFILYKPKDIISGDFYWFTEHKNKLIMATGDCTGHGVPGALLSMIGLYLLKNIVFLKNIAAPADILNELNISFCDIFKVGKDNSQSIQDGMDISICSIDKQNRSLTFSSACRPLYIIRQGKLIEFKGDLLPIGGALLYERVPYKDQQIPLEKGDKIYMFTDGFSDQFGGDRVKKLKTSGFKELLLTHKEQDMITQKRVLEEFFTQWKKKEVQTDDILVTGIEINE